jgi:hypothetical protein
MTEAIHHTFTPKLIYLSTHSVTEDVLQELIDTQFGQTDIDQITWINTDKATFTIEMVRDLTQSMSFASFKGKVRHVILLSIDQATLEAQNALLKLLEEPPAKTQLWLTAVSENKLLPTIISRCEEINLIDSAKEEIPQEIIDLAESIARMSHRELIDTAEKSSEREDAKQLIRQLTLFFHTKLESTGNPQFHSCLRVLLQTSQYLEANVTVRVAVENCFFSLKKALSQTRDH